MSVHAVRAAVIAAIVAGVVIFVPARNVGPARFVQDNSECSGPNRKIDLAFIIDRSGSLMNRIDPPSGDTKSLGRGQTYNVEIKGVLRALRDPTVIPRDGSMAVAVVTFAGDAVVRVPMREISSAADAEQFASRVETLTCPSSEGLIDSCPFGETSYTAAITAADNHLNQNHRAGAHRVLLMATDGEPTDPDAGRAAADRAARADMNSELDVLLMGLGSGSQEFQVSKDKVDQIVFPKPADNLPGATLKIDAGQCNVPGATFGSDCERQVCDFAKLTRSVLRSSVAQTTVVVNTEADPLPNTPVMSDSRSLRQAIELANCNGGETTITFACGVKTISPVTPLPALTSPDITIDGLKGRGSADCSAPVTIDGSNTDTTMGEAHSDGILIRSYNDIVRGLRIVKFRRAGIAIDPIRENAANQPIRSRLLHLDNVASNQIEFNKLEDNGSAGVLVRDLDSTEPSAVFHNIGNTISQNTISGTGALIDLGGDGVTLNDPADADEGPNTLLNFPELFTAVTTDSTVTFEGRVNLSGASCEPKDPVVEIFSVTRIRNASGVAVVQAVKPSAIIILDKNRGGAFSATFKKETVSGQQLTGEASCPIDGYTATFTDAMGNTSELIPFCTGAAVARIDRERLKFGPVDPANNPGAPSDDFTIENCGCSALVLNSISTARTGEDVNNLRIKFTNDSMFFPVTLFNNAGGTCQTSDSQTSDSMSIAPGECRTFRVKFTPVIPAVIKKEQENEMGGLRAQDVLAARLISVVALSQNGSRALSPLRLIGNVTTAVKLIDPVQTSKPPKVTLDRSGDNLFVTFSIFDSDLSVQKVNYEFFRIQNNQCNTSEPPLPVDISDPDLTKFIAERKLVTGQSFSVIQRFSRANKHPEAGCVRVTVYDGGSKDTATSVPAIGSLTRRSFESQVSQRSRGAVIVLPTIELPSTGRSSSVDVRKRIARSLTSSHKTSGSGGVGAAETRSSIRRRKTK